MSKSVDDKIAIEAQLEFHCEYCNTTIGPKENVCEDCHIEKELICGSCEKSYYEENEWEGFCSYECLENFNL